MAGVWLFIFSTFCLFYILLYITITWTKIFVFTFMFSSSTQTDYCYWRTIWKAVTFFLFCCFLASKEIIIIIFIYLEPLVVALDQAEQLFMSLSHTVWPDQYVWLLYHEPLIICFVFQNVPFLLFTLWIAVIQFGFKYISNDSI